MATPKNRELTDRQLVAGVTNALRRNIIKDMLADVGHSPESACRFQFKQLVAAGIPDILAAELIRLAVGAGLSDAPTIPGTTVEVKAGMVNQFKLTRATLLFVNILGIPVIRQVQIVESEVKNGSLHLTYIDRNGQYPIQVAYPSEKLQLALYADWHEAPGTSRTGAVVEGVWCGDDVFERVMATIPVEPVFKQN